MLVDVKGRLETRWSRIGDLVGLSASLYDADPLIDDLLTEGVVGEGGVVDLRFEVRRIQSADSPFETAPDLRLVVIDAQRRVVFRSRVVADVRLAAAHPGGGGNTLEVTFVESSLE